MIRAIPFNIHTPAVDEFSQNLPPKKKKDQSADTTPLSEIIRFFLSSTEKDEFFLKPLRKSGKDQRERTYQPLRNDFPSPFRKTRQRGGGGGVYTKWHGPHINAGERSSKTKNFFLSSNCDFKITPQKAHLAQRFAKINGRTTEICLCLYASGLHGHS